MMSWPPVSWTMELNSILSRLPMLRSREWTLFPGLFVARDRGIHPTHQRPRQHLSGAHQVRHDERQSARCSRV